MTSISFYSDYVKAQVSKKDWRHIQSLNLNLESSTPVFLWNDFVNPEKRIKREIPFITQFLKGKNAKIFEACLGCGATTIGLMAAGYKNVISNDLDDDIIAFSKSKALKKGYELKIHSYDWRDLDKYYKNEFDAILCLGNSLVYLFKEKDRLKTLKSFYNSLSKGGKLIIDERNYPLILVGKYYWSGKYVYCGKNKTNFRIYYASHKYTAYQYTDKKTNTSFHIIGYTMKENEMQELLKKVGFKKITKYGDYKEKYNKEKVEFYIYVAEK